MQDFGKWLTGKYLLWQVELGERKTLTEFAGFLGVSPSTVSAWIFLTGGSIYASPTPSRSCASTWKLALMSNFYRKRPRSCWP